MKLGLVLMELGLFLMVVLQVKLFIVLIFIVNLIAIANHR